MRTSIHFLFSIAFICTSFVAACQPNFVPDPRLREVLNEHEPDLVDVDGYITQPGFHLPGLVILIDDLWGTCDLTGLEYLACNSLVLNFHPGTTLTAFPAFPSFDLADASVNYGSVGIRNYPGVSLPPIPGNIRTLTISDPAVLQNWTLSGDGIDGSWIQLEGLPVNVAWPAVIEGFQTVNIHESGSAVPPVIGAGVNYLNVTRCAFTELPNLPDELLEAVFGDLPNVSTGWTAPQNVHLQTLVIGMLPSVTTLDLPVLGVDSLVVEGCDALVEIQFTDAIRALSIHSCASLTTLPALPSDLEVLQILHMPVLNTISAFPPGLSRFLMEATTMEELPALPEGLVELECYGFELETLPALPASLTRLYLIDGPRLVEVPALPEALEILYLSHLFWELTAIPLLPDGLRELTVIGCTNVLCLPPLPEGLSFINSDMDCFPNQPPLVQPLFLCNLLNSGCDEYGARISGHLFFDLDENGVQDGEEPDAAYATVRVEPSGRLVGTNANGDYQVTVSTGQTTVQAFSGLLQFDTSSPAMYSVNLPRMTSVSTNHDFALTSTSPLVPDRSITWTSTPPRPGFTRVVDLQWRRMSISPVGSQITILLDPAETFISATLPVTSVVNNVITMDLAPTDGWFGEGNIVVQLTSNAVLGTNLVDRITIGPLEDDPTPSDNTSLLADNVVVGSYDPNDKQVFPPVLTPEEAATDTVLEYLIRFQNTGTYLAERVVITDTMSTDLRWDTFRFLQSSHPCHWYVSDGVAHFVFNDIMLPDSNANEPESHGFVRFKIRPRIGMLAGESVINIANIYFDFNEPVITDPCVLAVEVPTGIMDTAVHGTSVFPNPTNTMLTIQLQRPDRYHIEILAMDGRTVQEFGMVGSQTTISVAQLPPGAYILRSTTATLEVNHARFVKE